MIEPKRLRDSDQLPRSMREALRSLERQAPHPDAVSRVERQLEQMPVSAAHYALPSAAVGSKPLIVAIALALAGAAAVVVPRWLGTPPTQNEARPVVAPVETPAQPSEPSTASQESARAPLEISKVIETSADVAPAKRAARSSETSAATRAGRSYSRSSSTAAITPADSPSGDQPLVKTASASRSRSELEPSAAAALREAEPSSKQTELEPSAAAAPREAEPSSKQTEAQLLYRAKRLAAHDPEAALRSVEALAERFPSGALAQERDVFAIQLHARMNHTATAKRLAAEFRARYPSSVYLRTLSSLSP